MPNERRIEGSSGKAWPDMPFHSHFVEKLGKNYHLPQIKSTKLT